MNDKIKKYKIALSVIAGTIFLIAGTYAPIMSSFLLTESVHDFTATNGFLIGLAIIFLWGRIVALAKTLQNGVANKLNK